MNAKIKAKYNLELPDWCWKVIKELAMELSVLRTKMSANVYAKGTDKWRGDKEQDISYKGVLGEIASRFYHAKEGVKAIWSPIVDTQPVVGADAILDGSKIDVKTTEKYYGAMNNPSKSLQVNKPSHDNTSKSVDEYHFIKVCDKTETAEVYVVDHAEVDNWEVKSKDSDYYEAYIPEELLYDEDQIY